MYGALSLGGKGLTSYGSCGFSLKEVAVRGRATLLEENSYVFTKKHDVFRTNNIPPGFRAVWQDRRKLAVAKLAKNISISTGPSDYPDLVLHSDGDRSTDQFIEVHIYGEFDSQVIDEVQIPNPESVAEKLEQAYLEGIRDWANNNGKRCIQWT